MDKQSLSTRVTSAPWSESLRVALIIYLPLRLGLSAFVAVLLWLVPNLAKPPHVELMRRWHIPVPAGHLADLWLTPWLRFDALWFMKTALNGYELSEPDIHHLPLYPLLMWGLHRLIGGHIALSALLISNVAFIFALAYVYRLARLDYNRATARRITIYLAIFPTSIFYLVGYTESLFLLGSVGAFYYARQQSWVRSGLLGVVSALVRPQGVLILFPLLLEFWQQERNTWRHQWFKALSLFLIPLSVGLYAFYLHLTFDLQIIFEADISYWQMQKGIRFPGQALWLSIDVIWKGIHVLNNSIDLIFALFGLVMTVWAIRELRPSYWLFMVLNLLLVISRPVSEYPLLSMPRFILPLFPIFLLMGQLGQASSLAHRLIIYLSLALWLFFGFQFALGGWVA